MTIWSKLSVIPKAITTGEKVLGLVILVVYVLTFVELFRWHLLAAFGSMAVNGVLMLIMIWSMTRPRGKGL